METIKIISISFIDEDSISVTTKVGGQNKSFLISKIEGDKPSLSVMNEVDKVKSVLNLSVLKKLDKTSSFTELILKKIKKKIKTERSKYKNK